MNRFSHKPVFVVQDNQAIQAPPPLLRHGTVHICAVHQQRDASYTYQVHTGLRLDSGFQFRAGIVVRYSCIISAFRVGGGISKLQMT